MVTLYFKCTKLLLFIHFFIFVSIISQCYSNDVLGCGGFVKSHVSLDFSKIEIGLYTIEGNLKEKTECAPTNGYYFLPIYERGEYIIKVHPPAGWSFEPSQVELLVDGESDQCSNGQDINFSFNGFGITGRVITAGKTTGPSGISVQLVNGNGEVRDTVSAVNGDFHFTPVIPGKYTLKASHPKWKLEPSQAVVQVKEGNTALPVGVLAVKGYEVSGSITSFGSPISGIYVVLYSKEEKPKFRVEGCNTALLQGVPDSPICHLITDAAGEFNFGLVPAGEYKLLALSKTPGKPDISYNIKPESVPFSVRHDNIYIKNAFEVTGFNIVGSVLNAPAGDGLAGVRVLSDGTPIGTTDATGKFTLPALLPGVYTLSFQHEKCEIEDVALTVGAAGVGAGAARAVAARWRVCGAVSPPEAKPRRVLIAAGDSAPLHVTSGDDGNWCTFLAPGTYTAKVEVSEEELRDGLQWYPTTQTVAVAAGGAAEVLFSQVRARVHGRVAAHAHAHAQSHAHGLRVRLRALAPDGGYAPRATPDLVALTDAKGEYEFTDVVPGSVEVSVEEGRLCWAEASHNVAVAADTARVPDFRQTGFAVFVETDHDLEVAYESRGGRGELRARAGRSRHCLPSPERYTLTPRGCHRYRPPTALVDLSAAALATADTVPLVQFEILAQAALIRVTSPDPVTDLMLHVETDFEGSMDIGPLTAVADPKEGYVFEHTLFLAEGETALVSASSATLVLGGGGAGEGGGGGGRVRGGPCGAPAATLRAARGLVLAGRLLPPVAGALVSLRCDDCDLQLTQVTEANGEYKFGPLDASKHYTIVAEKDSYVFEAPDAEGNIAAHKLAEIVVQLVDEADGSPLEGAPVSVSGGEYRRTAASAADGRLRFGSLPPARYYVRPHLNEYRLRPPHATLQLGDGAAHDLLFRGVRVAWSASGRVVSLGGAGVGGVALRARPLPPTAASDAPTAPSAPCTPQDATAAPDATFRIRGLIPKCSYKIELKESSVPELSGLKIVKAPSVIEMGESDVEGLRLVVVRAPLLTDGAVLVRAAEHSQLRTLRLSLRPLGGEGGEGGEGRGARTPLALPPPPPAPAPPALLVPLPRLPADNASYELRLESTLSRATHAYEEETLQFVADGRYKALEIEFMPKMRSSEQELGASSALLLPCACLLLLGVGQRARLRLALAQGSARLLAAATGAARRSTRKKAQ